MSRPAKVSIDVNAFLHNLNVAKQYAGSAIVMPMVKANAYGHGIEALISALKQADAIGVSCLEEALELREAGCKQTIALMEGFFHQDELPTIAHHQFEIVIHSPWQLKALKKFKTENPLQVWVKINTGMNRIGLSLKDFNQCMSDIKHISSIKKTINLMTHFSDADDSQNPKTKKQLEQFNAVTQNYSGLKSTANSAALINYPESHFDRVRPGIMLYGISPFMDKTGLELGLKPVMHLGSEIIALNHCKKGETIGYGSTWTCPESMPVGVVAMGYGDGYPRHAKRGTPVLVNGVKVPLIGRVSMDMLTVDLRQYPQGKIGDPVTLWGPDLPVEKVATCADTIAYELVCAINTSSIRLKT